MASQIALTAVGGIVAIGTYCAFSSTSLLETAKKTDAYIVANRNQDGSSHIGGIPGLIGFATFLITGSPIPFYIGAGLSTALDTRTMFAKVQHRIPAKHSEA